VLRAGASELVGIEAERAQNRRRDLLVLDLVINHSSFEARVSGDQQDVGVVVGEAAMLGNLRRAAAVDRAVDWLDNDIGRAAQGWVAELVFHPDQRTYSETAREPR
jgi:hypothetical protein